MMLDKIVQYKRAALNEIDFTAEIASMERLLPGMPSVKSLRSSLTSDETISIIAEIKRRSPSCGDLAPDISVEETVAAYDSGGARGISVLTDNRFFGGSIEDLMTARHCGRLPILRKDFIIHEYQVWESRLIGADAILLIAAALSPIEIERLYSLAKSIGLEVLVEVHSEEEIGLIDRFIPEIIGINNRDLKSFTVDLVTTEKLRRFLPDGVACVSESGIKSRQDMVRLQECGVDAVLVGEAIVTCTDPARKIRELMGANHDAH